MAASKRQASDYTKLAKQWQTSSIQRKVLLHGSEIREKDAMKSLGDARKKVTQLQERVRSLLSTNSKLDGIVVLKEAGLRRLVERRCIDQKQIEELSSAV